MTQRKLLEEWFKAINKPATKDSTSERQTRKSPVFGLRYGSDQKIK